MKKKTMAIVILLLILVIGAAAFCVFFDEAVLVKKGTISQVPVSRKLVAITFDDGPSPVWTPQILDELKKSGVKATFFVLGTHAQRFPELVRRAVREGHEVENHSYDHHVLIYYKKEELEKQIRDTERLIQDITGYRTKYFRPPKAWLTGVEKKEIQELGYKVILWSLNSKDWVNFDDKYIINYLLRRVRPGDIILFHDSGGVFSTEGGSRHETVLTIPRLVQGLKERGFTFVTIDELINNTKP